MYAVAARAESSLIIASMYSPGFAPSGQLTSRTVAECTSEEVTAAVVHCFQGYLVPMRLNAERYEARSRAENLDPFASKVYSAGQSPAAVAMIARRGWTSRLAAMAVAPDFRGRGVGKHVMKIGLKEATVRKDRAMILEVFEQNPAAVSLYTGLGFRPIRRLVGYDFKPQGADLGGSDSERLHEIDPLIVARLIATDGEPDLPWMLMPETLAASSGSSSQRDCFCDRCRSVRGKDFNPSAPGPEGASEARVGIENSSRSANRFCGSAAGYPGFSA
jgi:ribosomal protein S18 acetylase RimI-like enzyme